MNTIRLCRADENAAVLAIINAAATVYRGAIPPECWHEPYMSTEEIRREIEAGVEFWGCERDGELIGVMGMQEVGDVDLIRQAYVRPDCQRQRVGAALIEQLRRRSGRRMLVGTWAAASWAIAFYQRHGFELASSQQKATLLRTYWTIPARQIETSVVLVSSCKRTSMR